MFLFLVLAVFVIEMIKTPWEGAEILEVHSRLLDGVSLWLAAGFTSLYLQFSKKQEARELIDKNTGETVYVYPKDSFMFIPIRFWPKIYAALGAAMIIADFALPKK